MKYFIDLLLTSLKRRHSEQPQESLVDTKDEKRATLFSGVSILRTQKNPHTNLHADLYSLKFITSIGQQRIASFVRHGGYA